MRHRWIANGIVEKLANLGQGNLPTGLAKEFQGGFGTGADVEFVVDVFDMRADGFEGNADGVGDFFVLETLGQEREDFLFACGEAFSVGCGLRFVLEEADELASAIGLAWTWGRAAGVKNLFRWPGSSSGFQGVFQGCSHWHRRAVNRDPFAFFAMW